MVRVINKKTEKPYEFTDSEWLEATEKGLHKKFEVIEHKEGEPVRSEAVHFSPPELKKEVVQDKKEVKEEKPKGKKK